MFVSASDTSGWAWNHLYVGKNAWTAAWTASGAAAERPFPAQQAMRATTR